MGSTSVMALWIWCLPRDVRVSVAEVSWRLRPGEQNQHCLDGFLVDRLLPVAVGDNPPSEPNHQFRPASCSDTVSTGTHRGPRQQMLAAVPTRRVRPPAHGGCEERCRLPPTRPGPPKSASVVRDRRKPHCLQLPRAETVQEPHRRCRPAARVGILEPASPNRRAAHNCRTAPPEHTARTHGHAKTIVRGVRS